MSKRNKIILIIAAIITIAAIIYFYVFPPVEEEITEDGITYYPDGSYSYQTQFESGQINEYTVDADGNVSVTTIQQGTHEFTEPDWQHMPGFNNAEGNGIFGINQDIFI